MINKVILIGNVGADPEIRTLEGGVKVARVRLATTERIYNRQTQEAKEHTEWHSVTLWRNLAETADRFVKKGSKIYIEGRIRSRDWADEAGTKHYAIEILADDIKLLDRRPEGSAPAGGYSSGAATQSPSYGTSNATQPQPSTTQPQSQPSTTSQSAPSSAAQNTTPEPPMNDPDDLPF